MAINLENFKRMMATYPQQLQSQVFQSQMVKDWLLKSLIEQSHWGEQQMGIQKEGQFGAAQDKLLSVLAAFAKNQPYAYQLMLKELQSFPEFEGRFPQPSPTYGSDVEQFQAKFAEAMPVDPETGETRVAKNFGEIAPSLVGGAGLPAVLGLLEEGTKTTSEEKRFKLREAERKTKKDIADLNRKNAEDRMATEALRINQRAAELKETIRHRLAGGGKDKKLTLLEKKLNLATKGITAAGLKYKDTRIPIEEANEIVQKATDRFDEIDAKLQAYIDEKIEEIDTIEYEDKVQALIQRGVPEEEARKLARVK